MRYMFMLIFLIACCPAGADDTSTDPYSFGDTQQMGRYELVGTDPGVSLIHDTTYDRCYLLPQAGGILEVPCD